MSIHTKCEPIVKEEQNHFMVPLKHATGIRISSFKHQKKVLHKVEGKAIDTCLLPALEEGFSATKNLFG